MKLDLTKLCCIATRGGYYFLPIYTTIRADGSAVPMWLVKVLDIFCTLKEHEPAWADLSEPDASNRACTFLSKRELEVIDAHLREADATKWQEAGNTTYGYFDKFGIADAVAEILKIAPNKFPVNFTAKVHVPHALHTSLYTWGQLQSVGEDISIAPITMFDSISLPDTR